MAEDDKHAERRAQIFAQSLESSHEPRFGYFGFTGPLAIGDNSLAPQSKRKKVSDDESGEPIRNMVCNPPKKGAGPDAYFSFEPPLALGDLYIDPLLRTKKPKCRPIDPEQMFKAGGKVKNHKHKLPYEYLPQCNGFRDPLAMYAKYKDYTGPRNFYTRPSKKGGGGIYTPGVLFGENEEGAFWHHVPDDYDYWRSIKKKEREEHLSKLQEQNFNSMSYGNKSSSGIAKLISPNFPVESLESTRTELTSNHIRTRRRSFHHDLRGRVTMRAWHNSLSTCLTQFQKRSFARPPLRTVHHLGTLLPRRLPRRLIPLCTA
jgi:hypothetical protein